MVQKGIHVPSTRRGFHAGAAWDLPHSEYCFPGYA